MLPHGAPPAFGPAVADPHGPAAAAPHGGGAGRTIVAVSARPVLAALLAAAPPPPVAADPGPSSVRASRGVRPSRPRTRRGRGRLRAYLSRPVLEGPHVLGHGVVEVSASGGVPHLYQIGVGVGLLDHLTLRLRAHLLPGERYGRFAPDVAVAFFRGRHVTVGARYHLQIERPPPLDADPSTPSFEQRVHVLTATVAAGARYVAAGVELLSLIHI